MNVSFGLHEIEFEWDNQKAKANLRKHKPSFEAACEVFFDPFSAGRRCWYRRGRAKGRRNWHDREMESTVCSLRRV
jgi:hypothetical protein